jgi:predicted phosphodiesterase
MELAIISDIHGNLMALRNVLDDINSNGIKPEDIICAGDLALMGVQGPRCLRLLPRDEIPTVKGNTDRWIADYAIIGAHTHRSFARMVGGTLIANAGSVGR